jgi:DNA repair protein RadC
MFKIAMCVRENRKRATSFKITSPSNLYEQLKDIEDFNQECFVIITLNAKSKMIDKHIITVGIADASLIHPRETFRNAILDNAYSIVIAHNHPTGDLTPSAEDIRITRQLIDAGKIIGIGVVDHVIIGKQDNPENNNFFSMRESGIVAF